MKVLRQEVIRYERPVVGNMTLKSTPFKVLIACLLSLRTKDETTEPAAKRLFTEAGTAKKLAVMPVSRIEKLIYPVGFYKRKAAGVREVARILLEEYRGNVPDTIDELLKLPGVGRKTANVVVVSGFGKPGIAVDTHVHRLTNRWGYVQTQSPEETEVALRAKLPTRYWTGFTDTLITWGKNVCKPVSPHCSNCKIRKWCNRVGVAKSR
ncbi:endonuclease III [Candidatus Woesearchaeota archaeon]|nr:endonuclease III [Candidatus Woesearchaeota archaeon]